MLFLKRHLSLIKFYLLAFFLACFIHSYAQTLSATDLFSGLICNTESNSGAILVSLDNGTGPYQYTLLDSSNSTVAGGTTSPSDTSILIESLTAGSYTLNWTDILNRTGSTNIQVDILSNLTTTTSTVNPMCHGGNGEITFSVNGGWGAPYKAQLLDDNGTVVVLNGYSTITTADGIYYDIGTGQNIAQSGLTAGTYTLRFFDEPLNSQNINTYGFDVTQTTSCIRSTNVVISEPDELVIGNDSLIAVTCYGVNSGSIQIRANGGTPPYTYLWTTTNGSIQTNQGTTSSISNLPLGDYTITVTDANMCTTSESYTITGPDQLVIAIDSFSNISCNGGADGEFVFEVLEGTPVYNFSINGAITVPTSSSGDFYTFSGLSAGSYTVTVTDSNACQSFPISITQNLTEPASTITTVINDFDLVCFGDSNGVISGTISGGTAPYTITNDQTNASKTVPTDGGSFSFTGLTAGNYTFSISDANSSSGGATCTSTTSASVTEPTELTASETITNIDCFGNADGTIQLTPVGGTAPYTYSWTTVNGSIQPAEATTNNLTNLPPGTYNVIVNDNNSCSFSNSYTITEPSLALSFSATPSSFDSGTGTPIHISCNGANDGFINLTPNGGTMPYTYQWTATNGGVIPAGQDDDQNLSNLVAGTYNVMVTDANNCTKTSSFTLAEPRPLSGTSTVIQSNDCFSGTLGIIETTIDNMGSVDGINYTYTISGARLPPSYTTSETTTARTHRFENLTGGRFTINITDANGCTFTTASQIVQPSSPITATEVISDYNGFEISCFGANDGSITLSVTGGRPGSGAKPYTYQWTSTSGATIPGMGNTRTLSGIGAGTYEVTITDSTGNCSLTPQTYTITEPAAITLSGTTSNYNGFSVSTANAADGSINLNVNGGVSAYTYSWTTSNGNIPLGQGSVEDPSGLTAGIYTVTVTDQNNCTETISFTLTEPAELLISEVLASHQNVDCFGDSTGAIEISIDQESVPPYDYVLSQSGTTIQSSINTSATNHTFQNLAAGTYDVTVTDANGSSKNLNGIVVSQPANAFSAVVNTSSFAGPNGTFEISCFGNNDGFVNISLSGGTPFDQGLPTAYYSYTLKNSLGTVVSTGQGTTLNFPSLVADTYAFTATDATGNCMVTEAIVLSEPSELIITDNLFQNIQCFGANDGIINVSISGGLGNNSISWTKDGNPFSMQKDIANLEGGTYVLLVEDSVANSCSVTKSYTITEPTALTIALDNITDVLCFGDNTGKINITISGGTPIPTNPSRYQIMWTHNSSGATYNSEDLSGVPAGTYEVEVIDANGCIQYASFVIDEPTEIHINATVTDATDCSDPNSGSIDLTVSGGIQPYRFVWSNGSTAEDLTTIPANNYTVTVTDANGCVATDTYRIIRQLPLEAHIVTNLQTDCITKTVIQENELIITRGFPPYTVSWSYGDVDSTNQNIMRTGSNGVAVATITDNSGCTVTENVLINLLQLGDPDFIMNSIFHTDYSIWAINDPISFTNTSTGDAQGFMWDFGDGTTSTDENPTHIYTNAIPYQVKLTVSYPYGCTYSIERTIDVSKGYEIEIPTGFSPNKDGVNDIFKPIHLGVQQITMYIYDTWGGVLYAEEGPANTFKGWDGTVYGKPLENGNYIYQLEALSRNGIEIQKTGGVTLLE